MIMNTRARACVAAVAVVLAGAARGDEPPNPTCSHAKALRAPRPVDPELPWVSRMLREAMPLTDVLHNDLDIEVLPATSSVAGGNTMTVKSLADGLREFTFRLRGNMTISACVLNGSTPAACQLVGTTARVVTLDRAYDRGEVFTLKVSYSGVPARIDDAITFSTTPDGFPNIYTLSQPFGASAWWPCKDVDYGQLGDNSDKATLDFAVTVPASISVTANGMLVGVDDLDGARRRYRWATSYPMATYLVAFSAGKYSTWTRPFDYAGGSMPVEFNLYAYADSPTRRANMEKVIPMLGTFGGAYGLYPFIAEKYGLYQFGWGGGMEHQTNTGQCCFNSEWLSAHELAHQWWGDDVTCRTWGDIWLNEGFATYSEAIWEERKPGSPGASALRAAMSNRRPGSVSGTVYRYDTSSFGSIFSGTYAYNKGAWVVHMLRGVVGDERFFDILAAWRNAYSGSAGTTDDFAAIASSVSGLDLTRFFDQWVYLGGAPAYTYGFQNVTIGGQRYLRLHIRQTQQTSYGVDGVFEMPITARLSIASGSVDVVLENSARLQHYVISVTGPATPAIDPDNWILWTNVSAESYIPGPPKVVSADPAVGAWYAAVGPSSLSVTFSEDVSVDAGKLGLTGPAGPVPFTVAYDPAKFTATLLLAEALSPGVYALSVSDSITSAASGIPLDGEIADPFRAGSLPSGDGLPMGTTIIGFEVRAAACRVDLNGDGTVSFADYLEFLSLFDALDARADFDGDGTVNFSDYLQFLNEFEAGC
ncbi:MAG: hypothetical protein IT436_05670 [Phycisphaerales bacterium]|nr:hypothetical protein [Phycisphaerales bacterium]